MFGIERRNNIMNLLNEQRSISVQEAALLFNVTEETIRRDLKVLEKQGLVIRTHGGAVLSDDINTEPPLKIREGLNITGKDSIGRFASGIVSDGDTVFMDASTSSLYAAKHIKGKKNITVITNSEQIIMELRECPDITIISTGGVLRKENLSCVGHSAEKAISSYHANIVFFSCKGFSPKRGMTDSNEMESVIRKLMIENSDKAVFLCDHTKFNKVGYVTTARLNDIHHLITDKPLPEGWIEEIQKYSISVDVVE